MLYLFSINTYNLTVEVIKSKFGVPNHTYHMD
jgi:hypothetical protein